MLFFFRGFCVKVKTPRCFSLILVATVEADQRYWLIQCGAPKIGKLVEFTRQIDRSMIDTSTVEWVNVSQLPSGPTLQMFPKVMLMEAEWKKTLHAFHVDFHSSRWDKTLLRVSFAKPGSPEQPSIGSFLMDFPSTLHRFNHRWWMLTNLYHIWLVVWNPGILWLSIQLGMECHHPMWVRLAQGSCKGFGSYTGWWFGTCFYFPFHKKGMSSQPHWL